MFFSLGLLSLVVATGPGSSGTRLRLAVSIAAAKLFLSWTGAGAWLYAPALLDDGHLCALWVLSHPRALAPPLAQPLLQQYGLSLFALWFVLAWTILPVWFVAAGETALFVLALAWRSFVLVLQLRATPPLVFVTPVLGAIMPMFHYKEDTFFSADGVPDTVADLRKRSLAALVKKWGHAGSREGNAANAPTAFASYESSLRTTVSLRLQVPFPFSKAHRYAS